MGTPLEAVYNPAYQTPITKQGEYMSEDNPLSQNISEYHKAIESEFTLTTPTDATSVARDHLSTLLPEATKALESILAAGDTDTVRLSAIKLVFEHTLGKAGTMATETELAKIVGSLSAKSK